MSAKFGRNFDLFQWAKRQNKAVNWGQMLKVEAFEYEREEGGVVSDAPDEGAATGVVVASPLRDVAAPIPIQFATPVKTSRPACSQMPLASAEILAQVSA